MKLRSPKAIERAAKYATWVLAPYLRALSFAYRPLVGTYAANDLPGLLGDQRFIYSFWHEVLLFPAYLYARPDTTVLIGQHADGELITQIVERFGLRAVRGSSTRGGTAAMLRMVRDNNTRHFAITPDGPKGPRRECQFGAVYLASRTGLPIMPFGFGCSRLWRMRSWDKFVIPKPFARVRAVSGQPIFVPPGLGVDELIPYQQRVTRLMLQVTAIAERWAETGDFCPDLYHPEPEVALNHEGKAWSYQRKIPGYMAKAISQGGDVGRE